MSFGRARMKDLIEFLKVPPFMCCECVPRCVEVLRRGLIVDAHEHLYLTCLQSLFLRFKFRVR